MAILDELVTQIENPDLRARIAVEVEKLAKQKKFGLVFEEHLPECTPLWDIPVKTGRKAALKAGHVNDFYTVLKIEDGVATCLNKDKSATAEFPVEELVCVTEFGEPIYPLSQAHRHGLQCTGQRPVAYADRGGQLPRASVAGVPLRRKSGLHLHRSSI
jgi:adenine specific DNA methylase mod